MLDYIFNIEVQGVSLFLKYFKNDLKLQFYKKKIQTFIYRH